MTRTTTPWMRRPALALTVATMLVACGGGISANDDTPDDNPDDDHDRAVIEIARAAVVDTVMALGLDPSVIVGEPTARPCLDGIGNETTSRSADLAMPLPDGLLDDVVINRFVAGLPEPPLEDSRNDGGADPDFRLVTVTQQREGTLVTIRIGLDAGMRANLSVLVDCVGTT